MEEKTLYEKLGGEKAIDAVVELLNQKLSKDPLLSEYFVHIDIKSHKFYQKQFFTKLTGGSSIYTGKNMRDAHKDLELIDEEADQLMVLIKETLNELNVKEDLISTFCSAAESLRNEVLNR